MLETTVSSLPDAKKCGLCYEWFEAEQMRWDAEPYCYVCKDDEANFTKEAVKWKLKQLKRVLKEEHSAFPAHTPPDEVAVMYPMYKQLLDGGSRQEVRKRPDHAPPRVSDHLDRARCTDCEVRRVRHVHVGGAVNSNSK